MSTEQDPVTENRSRIVLGVDIGTSGIRGCIVRQTDDGAQLHGPVNEQILFQSSVAMQPSSKQKLRNSSVQQPAVWTAAFVELFAQLSQSSDFKRISDIVADATSSTVLLCDDNGAALTEALMYDDQQATQQACLIQQQLEQHGVNSGASGASSTLAKTLLLANRLNTKEAAQLSSPTVYICHQLDWFNYWLTGKLNVTDENNALKLGYDSVNDCWPAWVEKLLKAASDSSNHQLQLPTVVKPGAELAQVSDVFAQRWSLCCKPMVHAGTTDSIAGFLAAGANQVGDAVSSLGSTLAIKLISNQPVFSPQYGVYSHRLGDNWLVGGASNSGGAVVMQFFTIDQLSAAISELTKERDNWQRQPLPELYPLLKTGERFPIADAKLAPQLPTLPTEADPAQKALFLLQILQGLTRVELMAYQRLQQLDAPKLKRLFTVGGGTQNPVWQTLRQQHLQTEFLSADSLDAAFGVTRLLTLFYKP